MKKKSGYKPVFVFKGRWVSLDPSPPISVTKKLVKELSYISKNSHYLPNPNWGIVRLYDEKRHKYPVGLHFIVKNVLGCSTTIPQNKVAYIEDYEGLRAYQIIALDSMRDNPCGILSIPTGGGKTRIAIKYINNTKVSTLVLVPTLDLVTQWKQQAPSHVHIKTYQSIKKKEYIQQFRTVIFDECHHVAAKTLYRIGINLHSNARVYGLSATPLLRNDDNLKVQAVLGPIIYEISVAELMREGYLCTCNINMIRDLKPYDAPLYATYMDVYNAYIVNNEDRNNRIVSLARTLKGRTLILVTRIEHGERLQSMIPESVFLNGSTDKTIREMPDSQIIIATQIYDEGVDMPDLHNLIVVGGGKSQIKTIQRVGRTLRPHKDKLQANIYDFYDKTKWLSKHSEERERVYHDCF